MQQFLRRATKALRGRRRAQLGMVLAAYLIMAALAEGTTSVAKGSWLTYTTENSPLTNNFIRALATDEQGGVWIGTPSGLYRLGADGQWQTYTTANSLLSNQQIRALAVDKAGRLWVGTQDGLDVLTPEGQWSNHIAPSEDEFASTIHDIAVDHQDRVWVGSYISGLWLFEANAPTAVYTQTHRIWALAVDQQDSVWVGTNKGLYALDVNGQWTTYRGDRQQRELGLVDDWVATLRVDERGRVWAGTMDHGLSILAPDGSWTSYPFSQWTPGQSEFVSGRITALAQDGRGRYWIGTLGELAVIGTDEHWTTYTPANSGLPGEVWSVTTDTQGRLWVGTDAGLSMVDVHSTMPHHLPNLWLQIKSNFVRPITVISSVAYFTWVILGDAASAGMELRWLFMLGLALNLGAAITLVTRRPNGTWRRYVVPAVLFLTTALFLVIVFTYALTILFIAN
jgi:ligand-binding sensor domain-containing protein